MDPEVSRYLDGALINDNIKGMHVKCIVLLCNLILIVSCRGFWDNSACYRQLIVQHNTFKRLCGLVLNTKSLAQTKAYDISGFPHRAYARNCDVGIICQYIVYVRKSSSEKKLFFFFNTVMDRKYNQTILITEHILF